MSLKMLTGFSSTQITVRRNVKCFVSHESLLPAGGEGAADRVPQHGGESGGPGQDGGAAPSSQRRGRPGSRHAHQSHLRLQADRGRTTITQFIDCMFPFSAKF